MIYFYYYLLIPPHSAKIPYCSLAVFTTTLIEISYTKKNNIFKIQNLFGGCTKTFLRPQVLESTSSFLNVVHETRR
jgi:hypothetical protein